MADALFAQKKFLVVDDFADMRSLLRGILYAIEAQHVDLAANGSEALTRMSKKRYDVVLCDYNLGPGKDGQQLLEEARHRELLGIDSIFIMVTAENAREMVMAAVEYFPDSYLTKPFTAELLRTRLRKLFDKKANLSNVNRALTTKNYARAISELDQLMVTSPKYKADYQKLKADICIRAMRYDKALRIYQDVLSVRDLSWAHLGVGKVQFLQKKYAQAESTLKELIEHDRTLTEAYDYLARAQLAQSRYSEAEKTLDDATKISPRGFQRQVMLAEVATANGEPEKAETAYRKAISVGKQSMKMQPAIHAGLAKALAANGRHTEALEVAGRISRNFPSHPQAQLYQATTTVLVKSDEGDEEGAAKALEGVEKAMKNLDPASISANMGLELVKTYAKLGHKDKASEVLHTVVANNHDDDIFIAEVKSACTNLDLGEIDDASINNIQQNVVKTNNKGVQLIQQGQFDQAIELLHQAADGLPGNRTVNLNAAKALILKMQKQGAKHEELQQVRAYVDRVRHNGPEDWRLIEVTNQLQKLVPTD